MFPYLPPLDAQVLLSAFKGTSEGFKIGSDCDIKNGINREPPTALSELISLYARIGIRHGDFLAIADVSARLYIHRHMTRATFAFATGIGVMQEGWGGNLIANDGVRGGLSLGPFLFLSWRYQR